MSFSDIILIIISSAGLLHGVFFSVYLCFLKKQKKSYTNLLLGLILVFMAFRIGKSVMLNFGSNLEPLFIFVGLTFLLLIGPMLRWYFLGMTKPSFKFSKYNFVELTPFWMLFLGSFFVTKNWFESNNRQVIIVFGSVLIFTYLHLAFYIYLSGRILFKVKRDYKKVLITKSQKTIINWLQLMTVSFMVIWMSYFLNIIDGAIPYIVGPIMYSLVVYFLNYKAFQFKIIDINGEVFKKNENEILFNQISTLIINEKLYLEEGMSLLKLGKLIGKSSQKTSEVVNQYAKRNFNDYINYYRIQEAKKLLITEEYKELTISSVAFDTGFSSLSSFNSAFKKFEKTTPSSYRKEKI